MQGSQGYKSRFSSMAYHLRGYLMGFAVVLVCTLTAWSMLRRFELSNLIMVYLLGVVVVAMRYGRGPSVLAAVLGVAAFDFFFVPPVFTFAVSDTQYLVTFAVMLVVGLIISNLMLERVQLARRAAEAQVHMEAESLRNSLLSSISHDLRTPLSTIVGAASSLAEEGDKLSPEAHHALSQDIQDAAHRMSELMNKVLEMARLQSGTIQLKREWYPLEEVIGSVLTQLKERIKDRPVSVELPQELPWLSMDGSLIEQVLLNLAENAVKYTPVDAPIDISAQFEGDSVVVDVADRGPGLPSGSEERVFEKFYRAQEEGSQGGVGLGLAICRAIVEAHGGRIWAENRVGGGASFKFSLPASGSPPDIAREEAA